MAWVDLDESDNDPFRFWSYVIEAMRQVDPEQAKSLLKQQAAAANERILLEVVLPQLLNVLDALDFDLVLVLDDIQVISDPVCHRTPRVRRRPPARPRPPLPRSPASTLPSRSRAFGRRGELAEIRSADLAFTLARRPSC